MRRGYYYRLCLPRRGGGLIAERLEGGFAKGEVDPDRAEREWYVQAWPIEWGNRGQRTFFVSFRADVWATDGLHGAPDGSAMEDYAADREPAPHAADGLDGPAERAATAACGTRPAEPPMRSRASTRKP